MFKLMAGAQLQIGYTRAIRAYSCALGTAHGIDNPEADRFTILRFDPWRCLLWVADG
jgi:hypothetical protein